MMVMMPIDLYHMQGRTIRPPYRLPYRLPARTASAIGFEWIVT